MFVLLVDDRADAVVGSLAQARALAASHRLIGQAVEILPLAQWPARRGLGRADLQRSDAKPPPT